MSALTTLETDLDCVGDVCVKDLFWSVSFFLKKGENIRPENRIFFIRIQPLFFYSSRRIFPSRSIDDIDRAAFDGRNVEANTRYRDAFLLALLPSIQVVRRSPAFPRRARNHSDPFWNSRLDYRYAIQITTSRERQIRRSRALAERKKELKETKTTSKKRAPEPWWP